MKISIVMATYNGARYLQEQLDSFCSQNRMPDEVIIFDDCSKDNTDEVVRNFIRIAPFDVIFKRNQNNLGYIKNFTSSLSCATGDVIFFSDQDDVWFPDKIDRHLSVYRSDSRVLAVISNQYIAGPGLERSGRTSLDEIVGLRGSDIDFVHGCCTSFRSSMKKIACSPPHGFAHDDWVHAVANACGARRVLVDPLQAFRRHHATTTNSKINSFHPSSGKRFRLDSEYVVQNLRLREGASLAIAEALKEDCFIPSDLAVMGIEKANEQARCFSERASRLEKSDIGSVVSIFIAIILGKDRRREVLADFIRVMFSLIRKAFRRG